MNTLSVTHEIMDDGVYQLSVFDRDTGKLFFHWRLPAEEALSVATTMTETISSWMLERYVRRNPNTETPSTPGEIWHDSP